MSTTDAVYAAICRAYRNADDLPLTVREVQEAAGLSSTSVATYHIRRLEARGLIRKNDGIARSIRPRREPERQPDVPIKAA